MVVRASKQAAYRGLAEPTLEQAIRTVFPAQRTAEHAACNRAGPAAHQGAGLFLGRATAE